MQRTLLAVARAAPGPAGAGAALQRAPRTLRPAARTRRWLCSSPKDKVPSDRTAGKPEGPQMTRAEVDEAAQKAKSDQNFVDAERKIFGGNVGIGHPMVIGMAFAAFVLHYLNGLRLEQHEAAAADLERRRRALEHNGGRKTEARRQELVSHKREQLELWAARAAAGDAIAVARVERLRADIARLQEIPEADADTDAEAA